MADTLRLVSFKILLYCSLCHSAEDDHLRRIVLSSNNFAVKLHSLLRNQEVLKNDNIFFSPSSLSVAFGMTFMGSRKRTKEQISKTFYWEDLDERKIHSAFKKFHEAIHLSDRSDIQLRMVNRIWGHHDLDGTTEFSEGTLEFYNARMAKADFVSHPEEARAEVNEWVEKNTGGRIQDFIPPGMFGVSTRLALVNAVYFKGNWLREFDSEKTYHAPFYVSDDRENMLEAEMMSQKAKWNYFLDEKDQCQILELPYIGQDLSMVVVLPNEVGGLGRLEESLTVEKLQTWIGSFENTTVEVALPKFKLSQQFELSKVLPQIGIEDLFREDLADLSGISTSEDLHVSHMVHKVYVEVNEKGAEASAASGVHIMKRSLDLHPVFHADHPFLFLIYHKPTTAILFFGRVVRPTQHTRGDEVNRTEPFEENTKGHSADEL